MQEHDVATTSLKSQPCRDTSATTGDKQAVAHASIWRLVRKSSDALVLITPHGSEPAIYCIHSVAGDIAAYYTLADLLGSNQRFYGVQVARENMTATYVTSIESMASRYATAIVSRSPAGPFILAGFSAGAIIALEVAQQLAALGHEVPLLIALDGAPSNSGAGLKMWDPRYAAKVAANLPFWLVSQKRVDWGIKSLVDRFLNQIVLQSGTRLPSFRSAQTLHLGVMTALLSKNGWQTDQKMFMRAMYDAMHAYQPALYPGRVVSYETRTQPLFRLLQIGDVWRRIAIQSVTIKVKGKHGAFFENDATLAAVVSHLRPILNELRHKHCTALEPSTDHINPRSYA